MAHVVFACAIIGSSSRKTMRTTYYRTLTIDFYIEFVWAHTRTQRAISID